MNCLPVSFAVLLWAGWLQAQAPSQPAPEPLPVLILTGQRDRYHDFKDTTARIRGILEETGRFTVKVNEEPRGLSAATLSPYLAIIINYMDSGQPEKRFGPASEQALLDYVSHGGGLILLHASLGSFRTWPEYEKLAGGVYRPGHGRHGARQDIPVRIEAPDHPVMRGLRSPLIHYADELYAGMLFPGVAGFTLLASAWDDHSLYKPADRARLVGPGAQVPVVWTVSFGKGRVYACTLGHDAEIQRSRTYTTLLSRGTEWAATGDVTLPIPIELQRRP